MVVSTGVNIFSGLVACNGGERWIDRSGGLQEHTGGRGGGNKDGGIVL